MIHITLQKKVKASCELAGMSLTELAEKLGMSQQNFSKRLKVGKFTQEELEEIADENVELFRKNDDLTNKLVESGKKIAELQGKLDKLTNILNVLTGREDW